MKPLSSEKVNYILLLLDAGHSATKIHSSTRISLSKISNLCKKHCPHLQKSTRGCPKRLSDQDLYQATRLLQSGQMENATQVARHPTTVKDTPISAQTVYHGLRNNGMKARTKQKRPYLKPIHKRARMELAKKYKDWSVEDWK